MCWSSFTSKSDGILDFEDILPRAVTRRRQSADLIFRFDDISSARPSDRGPTVKFLGFANDNLDKFLTAARL